MTCVVGIADEGKVWMGADSAAVSGWNTRISTVPKVFKRGEFLIGYTTSFRMGQLLQYTLDIEALEMKISQYDTLIEFMVDRFVHAVQAMFSINGFSKIDNNVEEGGQFLVGVRGELFKVDSDYQVQNHIPPYEAIGCGASYALGSLHTTYQNGPHGSAIHPEAAIRVALESAAFFSNGVEDPFIYLSIGEDNADN